MNQIRYQIFTGPLEEDWLVAELLYGDEHLGDIGEWGNRIFLYPRENGEPWNFMVDDFVEAIRSAQEQVSDVSKNHINERDPSLRIA